ncbi:hypothetical protein [Endozoicomonas arenosclerae]|uniref:hypothetical protein n=1 Tax=Endozoicomonas arenosclerae TaxID=1633495 RepID=UPI0007867394|nr:hypothetical protein [Endozoicomonas arenosclerae]
MNRVPVIRCTTLWLLFTLAILTGCANQPHAPLEKLLTDKPPQTEEELLNAIDKLRNQSKDLTLSNNMYRRQLSLNYQEDANHISEHQKKVIKLFFQTLPDSDNLSIILSISPSSDEGFESINDAWVRVQELRSYLKDYSTQIEELYIPDQEPDTVTIQVLGGDSVQ